MTAKKTTSRPAIPHLFQHFVHRGSLWKNWPATITLLFAVVYPQLVLGDSPSPVQLFSYQIIATYPHSRDVFTQGLEYHNGRLYEGSGLRGRSAVSYRTLESAKILNKQTLDRRYFGEGITILNNRLYQLTWRSRTGFIYQADKLQRLRSFTLDTEGWGLCNDGQHLIYSDGSHRLRVLNPDSLTIEKTIEVSLNGKPLNNLNELEWVEGLIYANVWKTNQVVIIDPASGHVTGIIQLADLLPPSLRTSNTDVLNGIAYDRAEKRLLVTGKNWPLLFHIELVPLPMAQ